MTIYQRMKGIFEQAGIPGFLQDWQKTAEYPVIPDTFCTYTVPMETDAICADDQEWIHGYDVTVHLYSKTDASAALVDLVCALRAGGFLILRIQDLTDVRAGSYVYHKRVQLTYYDSTLGAES